MNTQKNTLFDLAASFVHHTSRHIFLTGRAGTGKTTFLKQIQAQTKKNTVVVAPTGVAAINAGGVTMHSFFNLPFGPFIPGSRRGFDQSNQAVNDQHSLFRNIRFNNNKRKLIQELELLIIDEVSMVRADLLDAVDLILRHFRKKYNVPFGGVQVLFIGDLFQLPPVVSQDEWEILGNYYRSPFFFDAHALAGNPPLFIELKKIYRQNDAEFIDLLNNVRNNRVSELDMTLLNSHYRPDFQAPEDQRYILLSSHNAKADEINRKELAKLSGKIHSFEGEVKGDFNDKALPAERELQLKVGAQIMFIKNDKGEDRKYFNGKLAEISRIDGDEIFVRFKEDDVNFKVEKETWKNVRYRYDEEKDAIEEDELGSFSQYPIRLAWAITIHKSQGLTFERAIIDAGASFAPGQVYVALSRLTSLDGLVLHSRINPEAINTDERIIGFYASEVGEQQLEKELRHSQQQFLTGKLAGYFDCLNLLEDMQAHHKSYEEFQIPDKTKAMEWSIGILDKLNTLQSTAEKFIQQIHYLVATSNGNFSQLLQRTEAACNYFTKSIEDDVFYFVNKHYEEYKLKKSVRKYLKALDAVKHSLRRKKQQLEQGLVLAKGLVDGSEASEILKRVQEVKVIVEENAVNADGKKVKEDSKVISLEMLEKGKTIEEIAEERGFAKSTIEGHLLQFIKTGRLSVAMFVTEEKKKAILDAYERADEKTATAIRIILGDDYSYTEIRAVFYYLEYIESLKVK